MPVLSNSAPTPDGATATSTAPEPTVDDHVGGDGLVPTVNHTEVAPPPAETSGRRRWPWAVAGVGVVGAATAAVVLLPTDDDADTTDTAPRTVRTAVAEQRDLVEFDELDGRMIFADTVTITGSADGVVTDVVADGAVVERGDVAYAINGEPVAVLYGDVPLYRPLSLGVEGDDVAMLEANLASLGHHTFEDEDGNMVDTEFVVDGVFDEATAEAVERWQADLGVEETGLVEPTSAIVVDGASRVSTVLVETGDRVAAGSPLLELDATETVTTAHAEHGGELELVVPSGLELLSGDVVYAVDEQAIVAIVSAETFERDLEEGIDPGDDVLALETMLVQLGYDADGDLQVDDEFTEETTTALTEFEEDLAEAYDGNDADGVLELDEFIVFDPGTVVGQVTTYDSETIASGTELWSTSTDGSRRIVETEIAVEDQLGLTEGSVLDVEFPDGSIVPGVVVDIASSSVADPTNPDASPTLAVEIELSTVPESVAELNELDVEVLVVDELAAGATVVPASALVSAGDGQFAVEAITTTGTTLVPVETGLFTDGFVEVTGLPVGAEVVVP